MNGEEIDLRILKLLMLYPSIVGFHIPDSRRMRQRGMPDWEFIGPRGLIHREVKGSDDTLTPEQRRVGALINQSGGDWAVWTSRDLIPHGPAEQELKNIA